MNVRQCFACASWLMLVLAAATVVAQDDTAAPARPNVLRYRKVFVPEAALTSEARGLLPLNRDEFERRMAEVTSADRSQSGPRPARITRAVYSATLLPGQFLDGSATLDITLDGETPAWLPLEPCNLALREANWIGETGESAMLGRGSTGAPMVRVEHSAALRFGWSCRGAATERGTWQYALQLPPSPRSEIQLQLPADCTLDVDHGLVTKESAADASDLVTGGVSLWTIELGALSSTTLTITESAAGHPLQPLMLVREATTYRFTPGNLDVDVAFDLDVHHQRLRQIVLETDKALQVTAIRSGEQRLVWREADESGHGRRLVVELPTPLEGANRVLHVSAAAEWSESERQPLPRMNIEGGTWQEGRATLLAGPELQLDAIPGNGCRQTSVAVAGGPGQMDSLQFEYFLPDGRIDVAVVRRSAPLKVKSGLSLQIDPVQATASFLADVATAGGERFEFSLLASRRWVIDSVETIPPDALEDRSITNRGADQQSIRIQLRHPMTDTESVRIAIRARRQRPREAVPLPTDFVRPFTFPEARQHQQLIAIASTDPSLEPQLSGDASLARLDPAELNSREASLFTAPVGPLVFRTSDTDSEPRVLLRRGEPRYSADIVVRSRAAASRLSHTVRIACQGEASSVSSVAVRIAPNPTGEIHWSIEGEERASLVAKPEPSASGAPADAGVWRLQLQRPRSSPFVLLAEWSEPFAGEQRLPLVSVPEAASQTGMVEVIGGDASPLHFEATELDALPLPPRDDSAYSLVRARFRYEPGRRAALRCARPSAAQAPPAVWATRVDLVSTFSKDGSGTHDAVYRLENVAASRWLVELPHAAHSLSIDVDGKGVAIDRDATGELTIPLPEGARRPVVRIQFATNPTGPRGWPFQRLSTPIPQARAPVLAHVWLVQLAPGLAARRIGGNKFQTLVAGETVSDPAAGAANLLSASTWRPLLSADALAAVNSRGAADRAALAATAVPPGWTVYQTDLPTSTEAVLVVYPANLVDVGGLFLALAGFSLIAFRSVRRPGALFCVAAVALALAMVSPSVGSTLLLGLAFGLTAAALWCLNDALQARRGATATLEQPSTLMATTGSLLVVGAFMLWHCAATARGAEENAAPEPLKLSRAVFPTDDEGKPTGDYVYLSPELYEALHRLTAAETSSAETWLIRSADYDVLLAENGDRAIVLERILAQFDLETFQEGAKIALPLRRDQVHLLEEGALFDGEPLDVQWNADGTSLSFEVPQPRRGTVQLSFTAPLEARDGTFALNVRIPRIPISRLLVQGSSDAIHVEAESLGKHVERESENGLIADLGPTDQLRIRCALGMEGEDGEGPVEVSQAVWWKLRPSSVVAEGRFQFRALDGTFSEIRLETDPRLRLLPLSPDAGVARQWIEEGESNVLHFALDRPRSEFVLQASFLLVGTTGVGNFLPPPLDGLADRHGQRTLAVSVDDGWQIDAPASTLTEEEFARRWGAGATVPLRAWDAAEGSLPPTLSVRPVAVTAVARQRLDCTLSSRSVQLRFEAQLDVVPPETYQYRVSAPPRATVRQVTVREQDKVVGARWWQSPTGEIGVLLTQPASRPQTVEIEADVDVPRAGPVSIPMLELTGVERTAMEVRLFRAPTALVDVNSHRGFEAATDAIVGEYLADQGRLLAKLTAADPAATAGREIRVTLRENARQVTGRLVTVMERDASLWRADVYCDLHVAQGVLDSLRLEIPPEWIGPFEITPAVEHSVVTLAGQSRRQLLIRPSNVVSDRLQLHVRSPLQTAGAATMRAPNIELLEMPQVARYVVLPGHTQQQKIEWETSGLQAVRASGADWPSQVGTEGFETFQIVAPRFEAIVRTAAAVRESPKVRLADYQMSWQTDRRYFGTARFEIHPAGLRECVLEIPPNCELVGLTVDGNLADASLQRDRTCRVRLGPEHLPQAVEARFVGRLGIPGPGAATYRFVVPSVATLPVDRSTWSIDGPDDQGAGRPIEGMAAQPVFAYELDRLDAALAALDTVAETQAAGLPTAIVADWHQPWSERIEKLLADLAREAARRPPDAPLATRYKAALDHFDAMAEAFSHVTPDDSATTTDADVEPRRGTILEPLATHVAADGSLREVVLTYHAPAAKTPFSLWGAIGLVVAAAVLWKGLGRPGLIDWLVCHGPAVLTILGIAVWLMAPLGWLGWLLVAAGVVAAMRNPFARSATPR